MKQPLMLTQSGLPPAQAEALYETITETGASARCFAGDAAAWPGEDWDGDGAEAVVRVPRPAGSLPLPVRPAARR